MRQIKQKTEIDPKLDKRLTRMSRFIEIFSAIITTIVCIANRVGGKDWPFVALYAFIALVSSMIAGVLICSLILVFKK